MPGTDADVIDSLVGIAPGSPLDAIRARRPEARTHAQASYRALFAPEVTGGVTAQERFAVGSFVTGLHGGAAIAAFYAAGLAASGASAESSTVRPREASAMSDRDSGGGGSLRPSARADASTSTSVSPVRRRMTPRQ